MTAPRSRAARVVADIPLTGKLILPSLMLTVLVSIAGTFVVVRYLAQRETSQLDDRLSRAALRVEAMRNEQLSYLVEAARVGSHFEGIQAALETNDLDGSARLALQTLAVRTRADLSVITGRDGVGIAEFRRAADIQRSTGRQWGQFGFVAQVARGDTVDIRSGIVRDHGVAVLAVAAPIRVGDRLLGVAIVGARLDRLVRAIGVQAGGDVAFYDARGRVLAATTRDAPPAQAVAANAALRRDYSIGSHDIAGITQAFVVQGRPDGTFTTWVPKESNNSLLTLGLRIGALFLVALALVVGVAALITRVVLRQVRELVSTHQRLAAGELDARSAVLGNDELGVVAEGLNAMADQLQASHDELERRVAARTVELERLYQETVRAAEAKGEFFAAISHELRTPLFVILGHAELMADKELHPDHEGWPEEYGAAITEAAQDLLGRVNEILELSKLQRGQIRLELDNLSIGDALRSAVSEVGPLARSAKVRLSVELPATVPDVRADPQRLRDILRNLLSNAIKFTPAGGHVVVSAVPKGRRYVAISVADSGVGIPRAALPHLFEPFYQVPGISPQGEQPSTGLGLAVAARLADEHGGALTVESTEGRGSVFTLTLRSARRPLASVRPHHRAAPGRTTVS